MRPYPASVDFAPGSAPTYDVYGRLRLNDVLIQDITGVNPLLSATWSTQIDQLAASGTITLALGNNNLTSTSPHMTHSFLVGNASEPRAGQRFALETATVPTGATPGEGDYRVVFDGEIDASDVAGETTVLTCRDGMCKAQDRQVEPADTTSNGFDVTSDSMLGSMEQIRDYVETYATDVGDSVYPLVSIGADPAWTVVAFRQQYGMSLAEAWQRIVLQRGWALGWRYVLDAGRRACAVVFDPELNAIYTDFGFGPGDFIKFNRFSTDRTEVRNVIAMQYGTTRTLNTYPAGSGLSASSQKYGRRYMLFSEDPTGQIDTGGESDTMLQAAFRDQSEPTHMVDYERLYFWPVEVGDHQTLAPDNVRHDVALALTVVGYTHSLNFQPGGAFRSTIRTTGTPVAAKRRWRQTDGRMLHNSTLEPQGFAPERALWAQYTAP